MASGKTDLPIPDAELRHLTDSQLRLYSQAKIHGKPDSLAIRMIRELTVRRILRSHGKRVITGAAPS